MAINSSKYKVLILRLLFYTIWTGVMLMWSPAKTFGQEKSGFQYADSLTYNLYLNSEWEALTKAGNEALVQGLDYYYLRMRIGIAFFNLENYRIAAVHFEKALEFNKGDNVALDYLQKCLEWGGMEVEAAWLSKEYSTEVAGKVVSSVSLFYGHAFSGNEEALEQLDIDGEANIYGELIGTGNISYIHAGLNFSPANYLRWYAGYTNMQVSNHQRVVMDGVDTLENKYTLNQHHVVGRFPVRLAKGWNLVPAVDLINVNDRPVIVSYDNDLNAYNFADEEITYTDYIVGLKIFRELPRWSLGAAISRSDLNEENQWQSSFIAGIYPAGNLNLYAFSTFSVFMENEETNFHFKQTIGGKVHSRLWLQGSAHFGHLKNAHDETSLVIFNSVGDIVSRSTASAIIFLSEKVILQLDYSFIQNEDSYLGFKDYESYRLQTYSYDNHHIMGGIKWKF